MKVALIASVLAAAFVAQPVMASGDHKKPHSSHSSATSGATASSAAMTEGEVRKVDKEANKITLKHGPISNLDMPGMTMVFRVQDTKMLDLVKAGDKVKFTADKSGTDYMVTRIEKSH